MSTEAISHHPNGPGDHGQSAPCCPQLAPCRVCDVLNFRYRLPFRTTVVVGGQERRAVPVEVTFHFRLTRCAGPLALGELLYTTTLLPGEQVRLATTDRHSRFSFDSESKLSYRHEATSEESFFMAGMARSMSDLNVVENTNASSTFSESSVGGGGGAGINLGFISIGGSASASSHDASSASTLARSLSRHAEASSSHMEVATRATASTSIGSVASRTHQQGESEDHFESASRVFKNPNRCHALTFFFYRIDKCQTLKFELVAIERRVDDAAAPTGVEPRPVTPGTGVGVIPQSLPATSGKRLEVERMARVSAVERVTFETGQDRRIGTAPFAGAALLTAVATPIPAAARQAALEQVDKQLVAEGLLDAVGGEATAATRARLGWERELSIPTPGVMVRGCLDECDICEDSLDREIELDLERKALENQLLKRRIELLDQAQEYRCCPAGAEEPTG